jgi:hypothetical protein
MKLLRLSALILSVVVLSVTLWGQNDCSRHTPSVLFGVKADTIGETVWEFKANHSKARCSGDSFRDDAQKRLDQSALFCC